MKILITGNAGFIGYHLSKKLNKKRTVIGLDNFNSYYDSELKKHRANSLQKDGIFIHTLSLEDKKQLLLVMQKIKPDLVINLAAQAGVRYSLENPKTYIDSNIIGFYNLLECAKELKIKKIIYASSSSVYGGNQTPFSENDLTDDPLNLYAASKKTNELLANVYSSLYEIQTIGLRFFSVYGPLGRPDMAYYLFTKKILNGDLINVYGNGLLSRDFTFVDDITDGIEKILQNLNSLKQNDVYNLGNDYPVSVNELIGIIEKLTDTKAIKRLSQNAKGEVEHTHADISKSVKDFNYLPKTSFEDGMKKFLNWYMEYYGHS